MILIKNNLKNKIITIPLHLPLNYPCDYIDQTAYFLSQKNTTILFDYYHQYSWKSLLRKTNLKNFLNSISDILKSKKLIFFRSVAIFPFQRFKIINKINQFLGYLLFSLIISLFAKKKVIIWQFYPLIKSFFIKKLFRQIFIYDCVDYLDEKIHGKKIINDEKKIIEKSDYIAFNSLPLAKAKINNLNNQKIIVTYCGCDFARFNISFIKKKENIAIFYGVFDYRINSFLLKKTIINNPYWQFLLIGPIERKNHPPNRDFFNILKFKNVIYKEEQPKNKLIDFLKKAKIGLIPYDTNYNFVKYSNPMKAYEYLAAGLPIVSTEILALKQYPKDVVYTTNNESEFSKAINFMTKNWNLDKVLKAKEIAKKNSWENKINTILKKTKL